MKKQKKAVSSKVNDAVKWFLFAYSVGHSDNCACKDCAEAREALKNANQEAA